MRIDINMMFNGLLMCADSDASDVTKVSGLVLCEVVCSYYCLFVCCDSRSFESGFGFQVFFSVDCLFDTSVVFV